MEGFDTLVQRLSAERLVLAELDRRCDHFLDVHDQRIVWVDDVKIQYGTYGTYSVQVRDGDQVIEAYSRSDGPDIKLIETRILPVLRKHMVLEDLSNA